MVKDESSIGIDVFRVESPPGLKPSGELLEAGCVEGNFASLMVIKMHAGELPIHTHAEEHVGVVMEGGFDFVLEDRVITLTVGDIFRVLPDVPHGVHCANHALIIQACD